jgi:heptosyltransferase-2
MSGRPAGPAPLTIAVLKPCCIGDCVMALPAIESLATAFPAAHVHAFTGRHSAPVLRASPHVSQVYLSPDQITPSRVPGMVWNLRTAGHDWLVILDRSRWLLAAARGAGANHIVTLEKSGGSIRHETDIYLDAVIAAGGREVSRIPSLDAGQEAAERAAAVVDTIAGPYAVLHPGGAQNPGAEMLDKRWPPERYAQVARDLRQRGYTPVLTGSPGDVELCDRVVELAGDAGCLSLAGKLDLMAATAAIDGAACYIGTDTGISHLAAATGTPSVVIFGPTNPDRYGPRGTNVEILALPASRELPDVDLRKPNLLRGRPSTLDISVAMANAAIDRVIASAKAAS